MKNKSGCLPLPISDDQRKEMQLKPFMPSGLFHLISLDRSISYIRDILLVLLLPSFIEIPVFNANSLDPDQTPRFAASDLGLHCLSMSLLWDARHKLINCLFANLVAVSTHSTMDTFG